MKKKDISDNKSANTLKALVFGVLFAFAFSITAIFIFSCILYFTGVSEEIADTVILIITLISTFFGGFLCARIKKSGGLLFGGITGLIYFLILLAISFVSGVREAMSQGFSTAVFACISSAVGGVIGMNMVKKK